MSLVTSGLESVERIIAQGGQAQGCHTLCPLPALSLAWALALVDPCPSQRKTYCVPFPQQYTVWGQS